MVERVEQVRRQTKQRVFGGDTHAPDKLLSVFEPTTEVIRKGKAGKPNEFGKLLKVQEAENQIVTAYEVYEKRPDDRELLIAAVQDHERAMEQMGVSRVSIPNYATRDPARRSRQKQRWFKRGQKWRTGVEGRISVLKRRHGLDRSRYPGLDGMWGGAGSDRRQPDQHRPAWRRGRRAEHARAQGQVERKQRSNRSCDHRSRPTPSSSPSCAGKWPPTTCPVATSRAANKVVVPWRL